MVNDVYVHDRSTYRAPVRRTAGAGLPATPLTYGTYDRVNVIKITRLAGA
jgi:hypothetical protein